jgi:hypothetical protein
VLHVEGVEELPQVLRIARILRPGVDFHHRVVLREGGRVRRPGSPRRQRVILGVDDEGEDPEQRRRRGRRAAEQ